MSIETRSNSALFKRAEQLKRWEESDTNREPVCNKHKSRKIKFSSGCVFLAACAAGEKEEVLNLLEKGADIDTANVDGLTALHQACIDDNLDMVEFLVEHEADVNRGDNEGWTPLHATVSCGFVSIAKYLLEHGANVAAVNCDGELALDIAENEQMEDLIQAEIDERGIDCEEARNEEKRLMLRDAKEWLSSKSPMVDVASPKTGATALHVASAKGYVDVIKVLLQCGSDVDKQDVDGWTPLHAAAHWGQKEAALILSENYSDMDAKNFVGQTALDVADAEMFRYLEDLKRKQNKEEVNKRLAKKKLEMEEGETPNKVKKVELEIQEDKINSDSIGMEVSSESETDSDSSDESSESESEDISDEKKNRVNSNMDTVHISTKDEEAVKKDPPSSPPKQPISNDDSNTEDNKPTWRRPVPGRQPKPDTKSEIKSSNSFKTKDTENEVVLRRTNSFQNDPEFYARYKALRARIQASSFPTYHPRTTYIIPPHPHQQQLSGSKEENADSMESTTTSTTSTITLPNKNSASPASSPLLNSQPVRRSFVPPSRDEESETQRKAHAKRVRETRRSTQGVTLEEIKSAEQLVKKQNQTVNNNNNEQPNGANGVSVSATITTAAPTVPTREPTANDENASTQATPTQEKRTYWRLRVDNGSKFKLEDVTKVAEPPSTPSYVRRQVNNIVPRPSSAPIDTAEATVTLPIRRPKSVDDKEQDKENDARNATLTPQAAIHRRRRPKRRSTGVVTFDNMDDMEPDKDNSGGGDFEDTNKQNHESGNDRSSSRGSRLGSSNDLVLRGENGEIDYKRLYEQAITDNDRLKDKLRKSDEELRDTKLTLEKLNTVTSKNSLSELEKRERRAMERKLSEMEEELKQLQKLKAENERLRAENRALTRVVSKLSNSAAK